MTRSKHASGRLFFVGCLLGFAVFLCLYGITPLDVTNDAFLRGGYIEQDIQQHYAGWLFYRQSPLSVPFGFSGSLNWPAGTSVAFTDSIPLFAAFFRLLNPLLPAVFQYFGLYTALCFALQGGFAALLTRLFVKSDLTALAAALPFVCSPILLERAFRHTSLAAHFLILGALYYYIVGVRQDRFCFKGLFAINCLAVTLHPYFVPMTLAVTFALLAGHAWRSRTLKGPAAYLAANLAGVLAAGWLFGVFGAFGSGAGGSGNHYGFFSMNLNALWNPTSRGVVWSRFLPVQNQTLGNYDGFNYLGLGILLALAAAAVWLLAARRGWLLGAVRRHGALLFVCACLSIFAVSNVVTANGAVLARLPLPQMIVELATTFRSSGRLFWPVYYLLFLAGTAGLGRLLEGLRFRWAAPAGLAALCLVQLADLSPALAQKALSLRQYAPCVADTVTATTPQLCETTDFFDTVRGKYSALIAADPLTQAGIRLALYTADEGMRNSDTSFLARYNEHQNDLFQQGWQQDAAQGIFWPDCLYVTERQETFLRLADAAQASGAWCGALLARPAGEEMQTALYVIAPGLDAYRHPLAVEYSEAFPLQIADYSDDHWLHGVLSVNLADIGREADENRVVLFYDTPLARRRLAGAQTIVCGGQRYPIVTVDDSDEGWLMVTLDTPDARALMGKDLVME